MAAPTPRPAIASMARYAPKMSSANPGRIIRLSANESALGPSPRAVEAMRRAATDLHRYPPIDTGGLGVALAERYGIDGDRVVVGCGSDELIGTLCQCYLDPGDEAIYTQYGFVMYPHSIKVAGAVPVVAPDDGYTVSVDAILERVTDKTRIVFLANPNNPTGTCLPSVEVARLHAGLPERVLLVVDSAYAEFVERNDYSDGSELVDATENVIMLRTFSKIHGLAGLRLGWGYGPSEVVGAINCVKQPFGANLVALAAGVAAIQDTAFEETVRAHTKTWLDWTVEQFEALGIECLPTVANFFLARFPSEPGRDAASAIEFLTARGIFLREMAGYGLPDCIRLSIGTAEEMQVVVDNLAEFMGR